MKQYYTENQYVKRDAILLRPRERLRSIVMSTSVCLSVCPRGYPRNHTRDLCQIFCMLPMAVTRSFSGRVTKSQGKWAILGVFFPIHNALYSRAFGVHTKTAEPIEMPFGMMSGHGPRNTVLRGWWSPKNGGAIFGENVPDKPNTRINCELDWSIQRRAHDRGRRLIASVGRVYYQPLRDGIAHRGRSLISTIAFVSLRIRYNTIRYELVYLSSLKSWRKGHLNPAVQRTVSKMGKITKKL